MAVRLFVQNLSAEVRPHDLIEHFQAVGKVVSVRLLPGSDLGGIALNEMSSPGEAESAVARFHKKEFKGRQITVNLAQLHGRAPVRLSDFRRSVGTFVKPNPELIEF